WCFAVGDVQGKGPEAAVVIGLVRPWLRLLAREGYRVADVLDRLNQLLLDDATEAADAAARALVAAGARPTAPGDGPQTRFLSLLYGELVPFDGGVRCTVASAGRPLPLLLGPDGTVRTVARPQTLLGVVGDATYGSDSFELRSGDTLLCVTDGVTERRSGSRQLDDGDGLALALARCPGLDAGPTVERPTRLLHDSGHDPPADDLALMVLQAECPHGCGTMEHMPSALPDGEPVPADGALPAPALSGAAGRPLGFYLHVPYCATRCGYCDFNTYTATELRGTGGVLASRDNYAETLVDEVRLARKVLGDDPREVRTVFVGGGTPTLLAAGDLVRMLTAIRDEFGLAADAEVTTEANPESVDPAYLAALREGGF